ncbi:MAG: membrane protein insertion efficiency factor YidD [Candidatus Pacebacteria bacterium]|nr:membrane protein insertion efficiency factor YidD [Candidatus Paceibacterota bacterium]
MKTPQFRYVFISILNFYQKVLSPARGFIPRALGRTRETCIFYPSCSEYGKEAFLVHGSLKGLYLTIHRVLRCQPFKEMSLDPVPSKKDPENKFEV